MIYFHLQIHPAIAIVLLLAGCAYVTYRAAKG